MLSVDDIHTYYGMSYVLKGVSLQVGHGQTVALLGRNGAGKTTTLRSIIGLVVPRKGHVYYQGEEITGIKPHLIARRGITYVPETRDIFSYLSVRENLEIAYRPTSRWSITDVFHLFPALEPLQDRAGRFLSGGEQQMLAIARALLTGANLILLDEPSQGLAPLIVREVLRILRDLKREGISILLVEQKLDLATRLADSLYIIDQGHIVFEGTPQSLSENEEILHTHLGVGGRR
ncbi:MAG: ABC transporter ATP-binding protein [Nitrospinota bacterium]|nr:MAG: ABC transporter ATP-binding protein [Nitrospinota bacterium]